MVHLEDKKDQIIADYKKGLSIAKLSMFYKCSKPTMTKKLEEWGVKK